MTDNEEQRTLTDEELDELIETIQKAYEKAGLKIKTATLFKGDEEPEMLVDNRKPEDNN